jgi:EAL domain-containing protein (putative c-di-GMP-specific phosphodiesterase class I)
VDGRAILCTGSIGIAPGGAHYENPEDLLRDADVAMYRAKTRGKARHELFDRKRDTGDVRRLGPDLKRAISKGQLRLLYQRIIALRSGETVGAEALLRWEHPERGLLLPREFLPLAEETGLILPIGEWVIGAAVAQGREWQAEGHPIFVSVNLSPREYQSLAGKIGDLVRQVEPRFLVFEISPDALREIPQDAHKGLSLAIEDSGSFSLAELEDLPVKFLKLDLALYRRASLDPRESAALKERVSSAQALGLEVVAKGVERGEELALVKDQGCDLAQGRFLGEPATVLRWF